METSRDDFIIAVRSAFLQKGVAQRFSLLVLIIISHYSILLGQYENQAITFKKLIKG